MSRTQIKINKLQVQQLKYYFFFALLAIYTSSFANNLNFQNLNYVAPNVIELTVSWENSWNLTDTEAPGNHDAVWLFGKYKNAIGNWTPIKFSSFNQDHLLLGDQITIETVSDEMGLIVKSNLNGPGDISNQILSLKISNLEDLSPYDIRIFGLEMLYVTEGSYFLGDGQSKKTFYTGTNFDSFLLESENGIACNLEEGLNCKNDSVNNSGFVPQTFPKGYDSFYCMKYEISQKQYLDFLNTLKREQQEKRLLLEDFSIATAPAFLQANRNFVELAQKCSNENQPAVFACDANSNDIYNEQDDGLWTACNFLNGSDVLAYLDWAGLRPMTELEFEKTCRGPLAANKLEFAWGTDKSTDCIELDDEGMPSESILNSTEDSSGLCNYNYSSINGPLRTGFAAANAHDRYASGASFYGAMEMSGNVWELCVSVDDFGILYEGNHGDGQLSQEGFANEPSWPLNNQGTIWRGGGWNSGDFQDYRDASISDRYYFRTGTNVRRNTTGGRGVR